MLRLLNNVYPVCGDFYNDDRDLRKMLDEVIEELNLPKDYRIITFPQGHFHGYPTTIIVGGIVSRNFHFVFFLRTETQKADIDVYCEDMINNRIAVSNIIQKYCRPILFETMPPRPVHRFSSGNYVSFRTKPMRFGQIVDRFSILGNILELGPAIFTLFIPPHSAEEVSYDILQFFTEGYISAHGIGKFTEVDIFCSTEISMDNINGWFSECDEPYFLCRTV